MIGIRSADEMEPRIEIRYRLAARVQIFYHDTVCYSQLVLGHFGGVGSSRTIPTTNNSIVFVLVGVLAHGRLLINGLRFF